MTLSKSFQAKLRAHQLWWRLPLSAANNRMIVSKGLADLLDKDMNDFTDFRSCLLPESQVLLNEKLAQVRENNPMGARFLLGIARQQAPIWLIHELHSFEEAGKTEIYAVCSDVSDMGQLTNESVAFQQHLIPLIKADTTAAETTLLQQQFHDQTQFLAMLSHELRSPLMGLNSMLSVVKQKLTDRQHEKVAEELKVMKMTIDQLNFLINDILTYAQTEFNQIHLNPTVFDLHEMADYICHLTKSIASEKGIDVHFSVTTQNDCFYGDLVRLSQVLVNLIVNAIKFTQQGGVEVIIKEEDEFVEFHVMDSGEGIDAAELSSIFTPFKQLDSKGGEQYVGSGLGLSIVKTLVDLMGGVLEVKSKRGEGTDFSFVIPMRSGGCPDPASTTVEVSPVPHHIIPCEYDVLVADDSVINRKVMRTFLEEMGCQVDEAKDGIQAWQKFQNKQYDYVFLDIQMPGLNGMEVCRKMREFQQQNIKAVKGIFALTAAHTEAEVVSMGTAIDKSMFDAWLEKPASQDKMIHLLHCQSYVSADASRSGSVIDARSAEQGSSHLQGEPMIPVELESLIPKLKENVEQDIHAYRQALHRQDRLEAKAVLHRLKGNLMLFELTDAVTIVRGLEGLKNQTLNEEIEINLKRLEKNLNDTYKPYL